METDFFDVLANPYRREIIRLLRWKDMGVNEITEALAISQPSVSRHLDIMKKAEMVTAERRSNQMIYSLNLSAIQGIVVKIIQLLDPDGGREGEHE
jgi:ArsR family transcriptional regulator